MKASTFFLLAFVLIACLFASGGLAADSTNSLRCGSKLVMVGDVKSEVVSKCGEPDMRDNITRNVYLGGGEYGSKVLEEWTYNFGPSDFFYTLTFDGSTLKTIVRGGRGSSK